jgi:hypothetical protein
MAESEILRLIAHAIADGFGADDTSGLSSAPDTEPATSRLLFGLLSEHTVPWKDWFGLAANVYLGCGTTLPTREQTDFSEVVAIQYGSFVVAAAWIDLSREVQTTALFGFKTAQARLCGVNAECAYIWTESTARSSFGDLDLSEAKFPQHRYDEADIANVSLLTTFRSLGIGYHVRRIAFFILATIAKVGRHTRIIDPVAIFNAIASSVISRCIHIDSTKSAVSLPSPYRIWSFEEAVGFWEAKNFEDKTSPWTYHTTILDSYAKYNTLLALSPQGCVVKMTGCCSVCAQTQLDTHFPDSNARRILSIAMTEKCLTNQQLLN